jgi:uncharacterized membrane protein YbhN (UPF0104 family)
MSKIFEFIKNHKRTIKIFIALILLYFIFSRIDFYQLLTLASKINFLILLPLVLYIPGLILNSTRFFQIINKKISITTLFKINWISAFFSNFLPSNVGGDSYKVLALRKKLGTQFIIESVLIDRVIGVLGLILLSCLSSTMLYQQTKNLLLAFIPWILIIIFYIGIIIFGNKKFHLFKKFHLNLKQYKNKILNPIIIINSITYTLLGAVSLFVYYFMFGYTINFFLVIAFYCFIQLLNLIPISINAIGIQETSSIYFFSLIGVPAEISLAISLLSRLILIFQTSIGGIIYLFQKDKP